MSIPVKRRLWRKNRPLFEVRKPTQSRTSTTTTCPLKPWRGAGRDVGLRRQLSRTTSASAQSSRLAKSGRLPNFGIQVKRDLWKLLQPIDYYIEIVCDIRVVETRTADDNERNTERIRRVGFCAESSRRAGFFRYHAIDLPIFPQCLIQLSGTWSLDRNEPCPGNSKRQSALQRFRFRRDADKPVACICSWMAQENLQILGTGGQKDTFAQINRLRRGFSHRFAKNCGSRTFDNFSFIAEIRNLQLPSERNELRRNFRCKRMSGVHDRARPKNLQFPATRVDTYFSGSHRDARQSGYSEFATIGS